MIGMSIFLDGDGVFEDWKDKVIRHISNDASPIRIAGFAGGMESGLPSVMIGIELKDGSVVMAETTLRLFLTAADALKARHGDPRVGEFGSGKSLPIRE